MSGAAESVLPHRYPVRLVDAVIRIEPGRALTAVKAVTVNEPCYRHLDAGGSSTTDRAYPVSLLIESWCQAALVLVLGERGAADGVAVLGSATDIGVCGPVWPGEVVTHEVELVRALGNTWVFAGRAHVDGRAVLAVEQVVAAVRERSALEPS